MSNDIRAKSAHASETALSVVSDWTPWAVAAAPAIILVSDMTERGGLLGFVLAASAVVPAIAVFMDQRRTFKAQIQSLTAVSARAEHVAVALQRELELAQSILEGRADATTRGRIPSRLRRHIHKRCTNTCQFCARPGTTEKDPDGEAWHIEHVIPVNKGGPTRADNLTLACSSCNLRKGTMPAYAFIQKLIREGVRKS